MFVDPHLIGQEGPKCLGTRHRIHLRRVEQIIIRKIPAAQDVGLAAGVAISEGDYSSCGHCLQFSAGWLHLLITRVAYPMRCPLLPRADASAPQTPSPELPPPDKGCMRNGKELAQTPCHDWGLMTSR